MHSLHTSAICRPMSVRSGSVLLVILVVIALLALGAYSFSETMVSESQATGVFGRESQARACADSGIDLAAAVLGRASAEGVYENVHHDPQQFGGVTLKESATPRGRARFSLVAPNESDLTGTTIRMGLIDESSKLNINSLTHEDQGQSTIGSLATLSGSASAGSSPPSSGATGGSGSSGSSTSTSSTSSSNTSSSSSTSSTSTNTPEGRLLMIPGMTAELADAILDFIDDDDDPRANGCESEYYQSLTPVYSAKNGPLETLDELLLVRGVTPDLLYGEDANRNGILDPNENDGPASWPPDNADGTLQLGWSSYLTVFGREKNLQFDGTPRININNNNLADLYDQLEKTFDAQVAQFVIAYRVNGQSQSGGQNQSGGQGQSGGKSMSAAGSSKSGSASAAIASKSGAATASGPAAQQAQQLQTAAKALGNAIGGGGSGTVTRGGMDLSKGAGRELQSLYEMFGATATATVNGSAQTLQSPWSVNGTDMLGYLPQVLDTLTLADDPVIDGRININQARRETLLTIPGMTESLADSILAARQGTDGGPLADPAGSRATAGWLVVENLVDLPTMQQLDRYLTARGGIYRVQSVGYFDEAGPFTRLEAVIDTTQSMKPPVVISLTDLTDLGRGYPQAILISQ